MVQLCGGRKTSYLQQAAADLRLEAPLWRSLGRARLPRSPRSAEPTTTHDFGAPTPPRVLDVRAPMFAVLCITAAEAPELWRRWPGAGVGRLCARGGGGTASSGARVEQRAVTPKRRHTCRDPAEDHGTRSARRLVSAEGHPHTPTSSPLRVHSHVVVAEVHRTHSIVTSTIATKRHAKRAY